MRIEEEPSTAAGSTSSSEGDQGEELHREDQRQEHLRRGKEIEEGHSSAKDQGKDLHLEDQRQEQQRRRNRIEEGRQPVIHAEAKGQEDIYTDGGVRGDLPRRQRCGAVVFYNHRN